MPSGLEGFDLQEFQQFLSELRQPSWVELDPPKPSEYEIQPVGLLGCWLLFPTPLLTAKTEDSVYTNATYKWVCRLNVE